MIVRPIENIRYAHISGYTNCTYSEDGNSIITCGADGDVRIWNGIDDDDPTSSCLGEFILAVAQYDKKILASTDVNVVYVYKFPEISREEILFRFTAPANCIKINKKFIAAGSEDTEIKVLARDKNESSAFELKGHTGPILYLDISKNDLLASCSGDGTIRVWDLNEKKTIKTITGLPKITSFETAKYFGTPCFEPKNGKFLVYCNNNEIIALNCDNWEIKMKLEYESNSYTYCSFSHCGSYIAAGTVEGKVVVWDVMKNEVIPKTNTVLLEELENITSVEWNPKNGGNKEFAYCDSCGHLGIMKLNVKKQLDNTSDFLSQEADEKNKRRNSIEDDLNDIQYTDNENDDLVSLEKLKNDTYKEFDVNLSDDEQDRRTNLSQTSFQSTGKKYEVKVFTQQQPFQPGATPEDLEHRYLTWNNIGIIRAHKDNDCGSIDVEFHNVNLHHALHMSNYMNHTMGSLSSSVVALSGYNFNKFVCITLGSSGSREWSLELPNCEGIMAIAATSELVAVATNSNLIRIFSVLGTQREVISIPGPVVAMCGYEDKIMITYHRAPASEDQYISAMLLQTFGYTLRCREIHIPITPGKKLTWIGYSDKGSPLCYDTMGLLQMYNMKTNCWYPICETMEHVGSVSNNFYVIEVSENNQNIQGIICRGCAYPMTSPKPIVTEIPMKIPLCEIESDKSQLEETLIRLSTFSVNDSEKLIKETAIKLFALACRTEMEARAKELIEMIGSPHLLTLAVKYASKLGRIHLADKLSELLPQVEEKLKERENELKDSASDVMNLLQNDSFKESLLLIQHNKSKFSTPQSSPVVAPKPMSLSNNKRNPFRKSSTSNLTPSNKNNPLSHLTEKIIQAEVKHSELEIPESQQSTQMINKENDEIPSTYENQTKPVTTTEKSTSSGKTKFIEWFCENRKKLEEKHPDVNSNELTKIGLKEFKLQINSEKESYSSSNSNLTKRKLEESTEEKECGVSKLSKFEFKK